MKSLWQEAVDNTKFRVIDLGQIDTEAWTWRSMDHDGKCDHLSKRQVEYYAANGLRVFEQTGRGVVCQHCAVTHVRSLNRSYRRIFQAHDHGKYDSVDALEAAVLALWGKNLVEKGFAFYLHPLDHIRNPNPEGMIFGACRFNEEQIRESIGWERERLQECGKTPKLRYRVFRYFSSYGRWDIQVISLGQNEIFNESRVFADIHNQWEMIDAGSMNLVGVRPGSYELERIANPCGHKVPWLVLKGTEIGMSETFWQAQRSGRLNEDPASEEFGASMPTSAYDIDLCYKGDLPNFAIVKN